MNHDRRLTARGWAGTLGLSAALMAMPPFAQAEDIGKKACMADAKRLCAAVVHAFNRKGAEACLFQKIEQTTPQCHDTILLIHAQREQQRQKPKTT